MSEYKNILTKEFWMEFLERGFKQPTTLEASHKGQVYKSFDVADSHRLKAEEIDAIRQTQSKGFRIIDIDPNALNKADYFCVYDDADLSRIVGVPVNGYTIPNSRIDSLLPSDSGSPRPYWRSFYCDVPGNFLKIEYLPARVTAGQLVNAVDENPVSIVPQNTDYMVNTDQFVGLAQDAGRAIMLLDFEQPSNSPHIVKDGAVFKTYFSGFYLTFKQLNVRIRITIGFNSEIQEQKHKEETLALWGGRGLTAESPVHPIPFCFSHRDIGPSILNGMSFSPTVPTYTTLIWNEIITPVSAPRQMGVCILFLTGFDVNFWCGEKDFPTSPAIFEVELLHVRVSPLDPRITNYTIRRFANAYAQVNASSTDRVSLVFDEPIRVTLRPGEALSIRATGLNGIRENQTRYGFSLRGYSFGNFLPFDFQAPLPHAPFSFRTFYHEHPFPQDLDTADMPRR